MKRCMGLLVAFAALFMGMQLHTRAAGAADVSGSAAAPATVLQDEVSQNMIAAAAVEEEHNYTIYVNRACNCVTVVETDIYGNQTPVKAFACSCAKDVYSTPLGTFQTSNYYVWRFMFGDCYTRYAVRFAPNLLLHSVPYRTAKPNDLNYNQYNKLGNAASMGCVRLAVADAKWIFENTKPGTPVIIYSDPDNPGALGKPDPMRIDTSSPYRGWDPTDASPENPWLEVYGVTPEYFSFNEFAYADANPDLKAAFGYNKPMLWQHYMDYGISEGRTAVFQ